MSNFIFEVWKGWVEYPMAGGLRRRSESMKIVAADVNEALKKSGWYTKEEYVTCASRGVWNWRFWKPKTQKYDENGMLCESDGEIWLEVNMLGVS